MKHLGKLAVIFIMVLLLLPAEDGLCAGKKKKSAAKAAYKSGKTVRKSAAKTGGYKRSRESTIISNAVNEKKWLLGKIIGGGGNVVTVQLEHRTSPTTHYRQDLSTNKFGFYAFSDMGQGSPSEYKLIILSGHNEVKQVSLKGIRAGGRVPDITIK
ncbi:MAG: hypothetical protein BWK80_21315 [Desulfobacteraceae bacterium IS3]|nr:MAG: hypothetical protein BWK80_21315 [Desulfobacteraceae bacterium IS3]